MSKASKIILLCEDKLQEVVVKRFLKKGWNIPSREITAIDYPEGKGSGERHVLTQYPNELKAYRTRSAHAQTILIVVIDADTKIVRQHHQELDGVCISPRQVNEAVLHVIPKRNIETWLAYLDGQLGNEDRDYKTKYQFRGREADGHRLVDQLSETCKNKISLVSPPPSLLEACNEFCSRVAPFL